MEHYCTSNIRLFIHNILLLHNFSHIIDIILYIDDYNRVKLQEIPEVEGSDYINASFLNVCRYAILIACSDFLFNAWIQGYEKQKAYVAAQGNNY